MDIVIPASGNLILFLGAALALLVVPGPAVLYIVSRSVAEGRIAGVVSVLGIHAATLVHIAAAALGLSAILALSSLAFGLVKYAGAAYLVWLGLKKIFADDTAAEAGVAISLKKGYARVFREGFVVNLLNPKTAIFFLAFLPQFIDLARGHVASQIVVLGGILMLLGLVTDGCYALAAGTVGGWLRQRGGFRKCERYVTGLVLIGLGLVAATAGNRTK